MNPICELQRLTSRLRAGEKFPLERVSCGSRTRLSELEAHGHRPAWMPVGRFAARPRTRLMRKFEGRSVKRSELFHTSRFTLQTSRSSGGRTRTFTRLLNREPPYRWATPDSASAQWESNPHFRHGKAAGYRYIMGAKMHHYQIVKDQKSRAPSRNRTRITSLRRRSLAVRPSVLVLKWDR